MAWDKARTVKWLVISVAVTIGGTFALWHLFGFGAFFGFLFLPFLPIMFGGGRRGHERATAPDHESFERACPQCGRRSVDPTDRFCPRDGTPLR